MKKNYVIIFSPGLDRDEVINYLSSLKMVDHWFYNMPNSSFIQSSASAKELSDAIIEKFGKKRHFITEVSANRQGLMPKDHWVNFYVKDS